MTLRISISTHKPVYVYILKCADNSYYVGVTNDLDRRLQEHQDGIDKKDYTYSRRPVELKFYEYFSNASSRIDFEKQIKGWTRRKKEALIERNWEKVKKYAECQNDSHYMSFNK